MIELIRFESATPNRRGRHPGVFAVANGLARTGRLTTSDVEWLRLANEEAEGAYVDPTTVAPHCYDRQLNPGARAWFKTSATDLIAMTRSYLDLLDRYGVAWVELRTQLPGRVLYEDEVQVVAVPHGDESRKPSDDLCGAS